MSHGSRPHEYVPPAEAVERARRSNAKVEIGKIIASAALWSAIAFLFLLYERLFVWELAVAAYWWWQMARVFAIYRSNFQQH